MRIAITITIPGGRISPMFEAAGQAVVLDCHRGRLQGQLQVPLPVLPAAKIDNLVSLGVEVLLCGAIANDTADQVVQHGMQLHSFAAGDWREVLSGWLAQNNLQECHLMPGCGRRRRQRRRHCGN